MLYGQPIFQRGLYINDVFVLIYNYKCLRGNCADVWPFHVLCLITEFKRSVCNWIISKGLNPRHYELLLNSNLTGHSVHGRMLFLLFTSNQAWQQETKGGIRIQLPPNKYHVWVLHNIGFKVFLMTIGLVDSQSKFLIC